MTANSAGAGSRKRLTGRRELLSSREVLYPLLCRRKRADRNAAYLGDGSRLKLVAFSAPGSVMARCASRRWGGRLLSPADRCGPLPWLISSGATTVVPQRASSLCPTKFNSSPRTRRGFCAQCGSTLTCEGDRLPTETHFHVGAFDQAERFQPTRHIFPEEQLPWLHLGEA